MVVGIVMATLFTLAIVMVWGPGHDASPPSHPRCFRILFSTLMGILRFTEVGEDMFF